MSSHQFYGEKLNSESVGLHTYTKKISNVSGVDSPGAYSQPTTNLEKFNASNPLQPFLTQPSVLNKLTAVIHQTNTSWSHRCDEIVQLCSACSNKELIDILPTLLHSIFGYSGGLGWKLDSLTPATHDYFSILNFLKPSGFVFNMINKLLTDPDALFQLPLSMMPICVTDEMRKGMSSWYQSKVSFHTVNQQFINFNSLEYFLVLYSYFIIHPSNMQAQWTSVADVLYVRLFEEYLNFFYPLNEVQIESVQVVQQFTPKFNTFRTPSSTLLRQQFETNVVLNANTQTSYAEIFLQILCDFWLGQNTENQMKEEYKLPSVDYARMIRILVKYLHTFINSKHGVHVELPMAHLARVIVPGLFNKRLYIYLKLCFMHWPLDTSFRMVLETWLSFIQPWRYLNSNTSSDEEGMDISILPWKAFICSNFHFYSVLFKKFITRAQRHDFMAIGDVILIYRVAKVFSQPGLVDILHEGDSDTIRSHVRSPLSSTPQFGGLLSPVCLENSAEMQQPLFGNESTKAVQTLCESLASTAIRLHNKASQTSTTASRSNGWIAKIKEFLTNSENGTEHDQDDQKLIDYLEKSCHLLSNVYQLVIEVSPTVHGNYEALKNLLHNSHLSPVQQPDCMWTSHGVVLTDRGRFQVAQGLRRFDKIFTGDPELQPIRSHECSLAVRWLYKASIFINNKCSKKIERLYNRNDIISDALRTISKIVATDGGQITTSAVHPRVSLRFAASYYFIGYTSWFIVLALLFGFHWLLVIIITIFILLIFTILNVDSKPEIIKID
ncbi:sphingomyelin phosphodiesterase 4 isoform X4 [Hydra vulgaris]|uniref:Sphingomyelin phosphodiesterase 4 isoform X4 n=1 Tax=Hydra vulgaris TaxID=6087 RepID=A0ABM4D2N8_HYDVU